MNLESYTNQAISGKKPISNRVDFVLVFSVDNANPNGDPGYDNRPRTDAYTGVGYVTDVCIKRKIRNRVEMMKNGADGYDIWVRSGTYLRETIDDAMERIHKEPDYLCLNKKGEGDKGKIKSQSKEKEEKKNYERKRICELFFDIRAFGGVLTSGDTDSDEENDDGTGSEKPKTKKGGKEKSYVSQVRGPVSIQYAKSVAPILIEDDEITRVCPTKYDEKKPDKQTEMGRKKRVPFGVYVAKGSISSRLAEGEKGTGFSEDDLAVLQKALATLFIGDESTARPAGAMIVQKLVFFKHSSKDGNEPVHKTLDRVTASLKKEFENRAQEARNMNAYDIIVRTDVPQGIVLEEVAPEKLNVFG